MGYLKYIEGGIEMNTLLNNIKIEYVYEIPMDSSIKYQELCKWIYKHFKEDEKLVLKNNMKYLYTTLDILNNELDKLYENKTDPLKFIKLKEIAYKDNEENFEEFIDEIKIEYKFLIENNTEKNNYEYLNRLFSWYKLKQEFLESAIEFLSSQELDLSQLEFEKVNLNDYKKDILNIENY